MTRTPPRAPLPWYGGKQALVPTLLGLLPAHRVYLELFGGAGSLLLNKPPAFLEVYNDLDDAVVRFFRVLRDPEQCARLHDRLMLTPHARREWEWCARTWREEGMDESERVRRWFIAVSGSFSNSNGAVNHGWSFSTGAPGGGSHPPSKLMGWTAALPRWTQRLRAVQIDALDWPLAIARYDAPHTLIYADPPYLPSARAVSARREYTCELTHADHERLLATLTTCQAMVVLSGYHAPLYDVALADWECREVSVRTPVNNNAPTTTASRRRVECIWIKPNAQRQLTLALREREEGIG